MPAQDADALARNVGRRIAEIRRESGLTQQELATSVQTTVQWISRVENGEENLTLATMVKLANALDAQVRDFFESPRTDPTETRRGRPKKA